MPRLKFFLIIFFIFFNLNCVNAIQSEWVNTEEAQVRVFSPISHTNNKSEIFIGLEYKLKEGWKTYWLSPGEGGFPQNLDWKKSRNISNLEILWPSPSKFQILGIDSLGYEKHVIFPLKIYLDDNSKDTFFSSELNFLICKNICIPGNASIELFIPSGNGKNTEHSFIFEKALSQIPKESLVLSFLEKVDTKIDVSENLIFFRINAQAKETFESPSIFLHTKYGLPVTNPNIKISYDSKKLEASFAFNKELITDRDIDVQYIISDKNKNFALKKILTIQNHNIDFKNKYLIIIFLAFFGGLILNGMPCVLPVLSLKLLSMIEYRNRPISIKNGLFITSLGIIFSFFLLAITFIFVRNLGYNIGWGMQFQQPIFLMMIGLVLAFFSLNLFGLFEISTPNFINSNKILNLENNKYIKDFFNGFFATLMATPCSAPFVGTALTFAFTQSSLMMLIIFITMGIGMSSPYILVAFFPAVLNFIPKPGYWMQYLKYFFGILLIGTMIWIGSILLNHFNYYFIIFSIFLFLSNFIFLFYMKQKILFSLFSIILFFSLPNFSIFNSENIKKELDWIDLNNVNFEKLLDNDNVVFVDITADWCLTCKYNKINVLNTKFIKELFVEYNVIKIKGDWTKPDIFIENFLQTHNRYGIPLNLIYNKNYPNGIILSELLSVNQIEKIIKNK